MFGLRGEIDRDGHRVGAVIGNNCRFGRSGEHIDADLAE